MLKKGKNKKANPQTRQPTDKPKMNKNNNSQKKKTRKEASMSTKGQAM